MKDQSAAEHEALKQQLDGLQNELQLRSDAAA